MNRATTMTSTKSAKHRLEAFVTSEEAKLAVEGLLATSGAGVVASFHSGTLATAARLVGVTTLGDIVIAELGDEPQEASLDLVRELAAEGLHLVLLGQQDDVRSYRSFIQAGAKDYFVLPLDAETDLALDLTPVSTPPATRLSNTKTIAICGASGGVGASILAQNLATAYLDHARAGRMARDSVGKLALVDADLDFGSLAVDLEFESTTGLLEALQAPDRVDGTFLGATMAEPIQGLHAYSTEIGDSAQGPRYRSGLPALLQRMRMEFPTVIVDLPRALLAEQPALADQFDELVLIMGPGFGAVRSTSRLMDRITGTNSKARITHILSHTRRDAGLKKSEIEMALEGPVTLELPQCGSDLSRAFVKGQPMQRLARKSPYARKVSRLVEHLETSPATAAEAKGKLRRFWHRTKG